MDGRVGVKLALAMGLLLAPALVPGCLNGPARAVLAASAPREASGLTLFVVTSASGLGERADPQAYYSVGFGGRSVYPTHDVWGAIPLVDGRGTLYLPYAYFVVANGEYDVRLLYNGEETSARVPIDRWVDYVFLHPYVKRDEMVTVDVQLSKAQGGFPSDRIPTNGQLTLDIYYRGASKDAGIRVWIARAQYPTAPDSDFVRVEVPRGKFGNEKGFFSLESKFDNADALGNYNVGNDPTMAARDPPWNWIWLS